MTYSPSLDEVRALATQGNVVPVYREVPADLETPVSAYLKVARGKYSFLLESVEGGETFGRYSFIGTEPYRVLRTGRNAVLNAEALALANRIAVMEALQRCTPMPFTEAMAGATAGRPFAVQFRSRKSAPDKTSPPTQERRA